MWVCDYPKTTNCGNLGVIAIVYHCHTNDCMRSKRSMRSHGK